MPRPRLSSLPYAALLSMALVPACFSLPHVDPGNRVLDDFDQDADLMPTWSAFGAWVCAPFISPGRQAADGGQDGGASSDDAGALASPDGGQPASCGVGPGDGTTPANNHALVSTFDVVAPSGTDPFGVAITTMTIKPGAVVDLTGFTQILFDAQLYSTTLGRDMLPVGTVLEVELGCSTIVKDTTLDQSANVRIEAPGWPPNPLTLSLDAFSSPAMSPIRSCLGTVDSISFKVLLGRATAGTPISGTLQLDNVAFR